LILNNEKYFSLKNKNKKVTLTKTVNSMKSIREKLKHHHEVFPESNFIGGKLDENRSHRDRAVTLSNN